MPALQFIITLTGMVNTGGDLAQHEQAACNSFLKEFGLAGRAIAQQQRIPASLLSVFSASTLLVVKDQTLFHFMFVDVPGMDRLTYLDWTSKGQVDPGAIVCRVRVDLGEPVWGAFVEIAKVLKGDASAARGMAAEYVAQVQQAAAKGKATQQAPTVAPPELAASIARFRADHPAGTTTAFVMMQFAETKTHRELVETIKEVLKKRGIVGMRADDKQYADDLLANIRTYMHSCDFGIAVFERILEDDFNPNVSLEVGYMMGLGKPLCLLKDRTLKQLPTDLVGRLYRPFDPLDVVGSVPAEIEKWVKDKGFAR